MFVSVLSNILKYFRTSIEVIHICIKKVIIAMMQDSALDIEPEVIKEVIKAGTDLRQYSKEVEKKLRECENKSIQDYIKESQNIVNLHNKINDCDAILEVCLKKLFIPNLFHFYFSESVYQMFTVFREWRTCYCILNLI